MVFKALWSKAHIWKERKQQEQQPKHYAQHNKMFSTNCISDNIKINSIINYNKIQIDRVCNKYIIMTHEFQRGE